MFSIPCGRNKGRGEGRREASPEMEAATQHLLRVEVAELRRWFRSWWRLDAGGFVRERVLRVVVREEERSA